VGEATGDFMPVQPRTATFAPRWRQSSIVHLSKFNSDVERTALASLGKLRRRDSLPVTSLRDCATASTEI
jgi:hypothetical protein